MSSSFNWATAFRRGSQQSQSRGRNGEVASIGPRHSAVDHPRGPRGPPGAEARRRFNWATAFRRGSRMRPVPVAWGSGVLQLGHGIPPWITEPTSPPSGWF